MPCNSLQPQLTKDLCRPSEEGKKKKEFRLHFLPCPFSSHSEPPREYVIRALAHIELVNLVVNSTERQDEALSLACSVSWLSVFSVRSQTWAARPISAPEVGAFHFVRQCTRPPPTPPPPCDSVSEWVLSEWMRINRHSCSAPFPALHG